MRISDLDFCLISSTGFILFASLLYSNVQGEHISFIKGFQSVNQEFLDLPSSFIHFITSL